MVACDPLDQVVLVDPPERVAGCEERLKIGSRRHAREQRHPIVRSVEPGDDWSRCYPDELMMRLVAE